MELKEYTNKDGNKILRDEHGLIMAGVNNPNGRPAGAYSLKTKIEQRIKEHPETETKLIDDLLNKEQGLVYQMIDGKPKASIDLGSTENPVKVVITQLKDEKVS